MSVALCVATVLFLYLAVLLTVHLTFSILSHDMLMLCLPTCIMFPDFYPFYLVSIGLSWYHCNYWTFWQFLCLQQNSMLSAVPPSPLVNVSGCLWYMPYICAIMLGLYRKTSTAFVRLSRTYIIAKEAVRMYGKLNQTPKMNWRLAFSQFCSLSWDL